MLVLRATPGPPRPGFCAKVSTSTKHTCSVGEPAEGSLPNRSTRWRALGPPPGAANPLIPPRANALVRTPARAAPSSATHQYRVAVPDAYAGGGLKPPPPARARRPNDLGKPLKKPQPQPVFSTKPSMCPSRVLLCNGDKTFSNGYLGYCNDEERSEMRYVMRIAEPRESSNL